LKAFGDPNELAHPPVNRTLDAACMHNGLGQFIEPDVSFAIQHAVALLDRSLADGLCQVALACGTRAL
jgi:hypothetical protein